MAKLLTILICTLSVTVFADSARWGKNDGGKKDKTMETKKTADHSGQLSGPGEPNDGTRKSSSQGPRGMQNTVPGTDATPTPRR